MKTFDSMLLMALTSFINYRSVTFAFTQQGSIFRASKLASPSSFSTSLFATEKARIFFLGTPDVAANSLTRLVKESKKDSSGYEIVGVVTQPPKRRKRRGKEIQSPVGIAAEELEIPVLTPEKAKDEDFLTELENVYKPDLCITAAYGQYLPKRFLRIPKLGTLNIHPSLLPRWRGASPVQRSLEAGDNPVLHVVESNDSTSTRNRNANNLKIPRKLNVFQIVPLPFLFCLFSTKIISKSIRLQLYIL